MYTQQDQLYLFYRGDTSKYTFDDTIKKKNYLRFDNVYSNFLNCDKYCMKCDRMTDNNNCLKCYECLKQPMKKPKLESITNIVPPFPKEMPYIPFPFYETLPHKVTITTKIPSGIVSSLSDIPCSYYCSPELCNSWEKRNKLFEDCKKTNTNEQCRMKYGCKQWEGYRYRYTAPLPPYLTDCEPCWKNNYTNI